jgi:hypothetical protein
MEQFIKESGLETNNMDKVLRSGQMDQITKGIIIMVRSTVLASLNGLTVHSTWVNLITI